MIDGIDTGRALIRAQRTAERSRRGSTLANGVVTEYDPLRQVAKVDTDDGGSVSAQSLVGPLVVGERVKVGYELPRGVTVIGRAPTGATPATGRGGFGWAVIIGMAGVHDPSRCDFLADPADAGPAFEQAAAITNVASAVVSLSGGVIRVLSSPQPYKFPHGAYVGKFCTMELEPGTVISKGSNVGPIFTFGTAGISGGALRISCPLRIGATITNSFGGSNPNGPAFEYVGATSSGGGVTLQGLLVTTSQNAIISNPVGTSSCSLVLTDSQVQCSQSSTVSLIANASIVSARWRDSVISGRMAVPNGPFDIEANDCVMACLFEVSGFVGKILGCELSGTSFIVANNGFEATFIGNRRWFSAGGAGAGKCLHVNTSGGFLPYSGNLTMLDNIIAGDVIYSSTVSPGNAEIPGQLFIGENTIVSSNGTAAAVVDLGAVDRATDNTQGLIVVRNNIFHARTPGRPGIRVRAGNYPLVDGNYFADISGGNNIEIGAGCTNATVRRNTGRAAGNTAVVNDLGVGTIID